MQAIYQWGLEDTKTDRVRDLPDELHNALSKKLEEAIG
jgi:hypothetical protein